MKKSEYKRHKRLAPKKEKQEMQTVINNLQNLLWLAAHLNGGSIEIPHSKIKHIDLKACRLDVVTMDAGEPGYKVVAAFKLQG